MADKREFNSRILSDVRSNYDGLSLIAVDPLAPITNLSLNCMAVGHVLNMLDVFFSGASEYARIWLHTRMATTDFVGIPFNHGFTDNRGTMIQHNGIVYNYRNLAVDSFNLSDYRTGSAHEMRDDLNTAMENFANVFLIRPEQATYGVVRMRGGLLMTDGVGNYSTHGVADIRNPVSAEYAREHRLIPQTSYPIKQSFEDQRDDTEMSDIEFAWDKIVESKYSKIG